MKQNIYIYFILSYFIFLYNFLEESPEFLWGHYKPHLLFSQTQKIPDPINIGFLYYIPKKINFIDDLRYKFEANSHLRSDFIYNNGRNFSEQTIKEKNLNFRIITLKESNNYDKQSWKTYLDVKFNSNEFLNCVFYLSLPDSLPVENNKFFKVIFSLENLIIYEIFEEIKTIKISKRIFENSI